MTDQIDITKEYQTRDGRAVSSLELFSGHTVRGMIPGEGFYVWYLNGRWAADRETYLDLVPRADKTEAAINRAANIRRARAMIEEAMALCDGPDTFDTLVQEVRTPKPKLIEMGRKYRTRSGDPVRILCVDGPGSRPVIGIIGGLCAVDTWFLDGVFIKGRESGADLVEDTGE